MDVEHREIHEQTLSIFLDKLSTVTTMLKRLHKPQVDGYGPKPNRMMYVIKKEGLDKAIDEMILWQTTSDQSWFLLMRMADSKVDSVLEACDSDASSSTAVSIRSAVTIRAGLRSENIPTDNFKSPSGLTLSSAALDSMQISAIPFCEGMLIARRAFSNGRTATYILNRIQCQTTSREDILGNSARDLVRKLQHEEPHTFGLLHCKGCILPSSTSPADITLVFRNPPDSSQPRSLRDILITTPSLSLSQRFRIAKDLAKSVGYVHTFGFVHKNVRPESVIVFETRSGKELSGFLAGFEEFRRDEGWTRRRGDDAPTKNLYRHPSRQGINPEEDYAMQHDIYSLGVCLLEIGLWGSFVNYSNSPSQAVPELGPLLDLPPTIVVSQASAFLLQDGKSHLLSLAQEQLPARMGDQYTEIVQTCLTCLDPDNADFGDQKEFQDEDGIRVGARYIEKVLLRLNAINV
ncbi:hypothetical protein BDV96DRAFT_407771 [Lophiotrema nucula]|uniref:Protein kinase domain-containing protein n=1 Tax=Lophiotrema nucula TaxID=690887 RepID=A0A6A5ZFP1_9PLEO|nr:hypothetical protein BDV96DRAFT_407771 [Lophiotrema nucula]